MEGLFIPEGSGAGRFLGLRRGARRDPEEERTGPGSSRACARVVPRVNGLLARAAGARHCTLGQRGLEKPDEGTPLSRTKKAARRVQKLATGGSEKKMAWIRRRARARRKLSTTPGDLESVREIERRRRAERRRVAIPDLVRARAGRRDRTARTETLGSPAAGKCDAPAAFSTERRRHDRSGRAAQTDRRTRRACSAGLLRRALEVQRRAVRHLRAREHRSCRPRCWPRRSP